MFREAASSLSSSRPEWTTGGEGYLTTTLTLLHRSQPLRYLMRLPLRLPIMHHTRSTTSAINSHHTQDGSASPVRAARILTQRFAVTAVPIQNTASHPVRPKLTSSASYSAHESASRIQDCTTSRHREPRSDCYDKDNGDMPKPYDERLASRLGSPTTSGSDGRACLWAMTGARLVTSGSRRDQHGRKAHDGLARHSPYVLQHGRASETRRTGQQRADLNGNMSLPSFRLGVLICLGPRRSQALHQTLNRLHIAVSLSNPAKIWRKTSELDGQVSMSQAEDYTAQAHGVSGR